MKAKSRVLAIPEMPVRARSAPLSTPFRGRKGTYSYVLTQEDVKNMSGFDPDQLDDLRGLVDRADRARELLRRFEEWQGEVASLLGSDPSLRFRGVQQCAGALQTLRENPERVFRTREVVQELSAGGMEFTAKSPVTSISACLSRASVKGKVLKVAPGEWKWVLPTDVVLEEVPCELCDFRCRRERVFEEYGYQNAWRVDCPKCKEFTVAEDVQDLLKSHPVKRREVRDLVRGGFLSHVTNATLGQ